MKDILEDFVVSLDKLRDVLADSDMSNERFIDTYGWDHPALDKIDLINYIDIYSHKISSLESLEGIDKNAFERIKQYTEQINTQTKSVREHFIDNDETLRLVVSSTAITLNVIFTIIDNDLFNWDYLTNNKLLPQPLVNRLKSASARIETIETSSEDLESKIKLIDDAHLAAESLPTDLKELRDTHREIKATLAQVSKEREKVSELLFESQKAYKSIIALEKIIEENKLKTDTYVEQCDEALQITTTEGLAAGFDQKAKQLNKSIWVWIVGLLSALVAGAALGYLRVGDLTSALGSELTAGQAILHTVISVFSIGGPLWLAWISTQQIMQRFKLAEDYAYKATVAKSYTGFSKHASRFDEATSERLFNSTLDRLDEMPLRLVEGKDYNSPWHEFLDSDAFKRALAMVPELANTATKFASHTKLKSKPKKQNVKPITKPVPEKNQESSADDEAA
ncbi:hypothetical protein EDB69_1344 [Vibrio crassostreae]|uniref:hypothetical protein n=1 Tax=Vibrio crassostreae TaxID=246167 RepID=UPI000F4A103E|nr:hypothetical protein [Vibrio crassostreae]ROO75375.1 hypothetical protein EDB64_0350 [Vibrio crassostreae]ROP13382.1 hypothetical protein EDB63_0374 [Vibrio crassostreae]ROQ87457.1 hypothetical protein EDB72_1003 [Vibrio crassostreae]ROR88172.1 hypothetical protein EDB66_1114 [Vibrio crassostreae]RPE95379.1 hypothetical protein EDB68_1420 [Vibrio crassostreae]